MAPIKRPFYRKRGFVIALFLTAIFLLLQLARPEIANSSLKSDKTLPAPVAKIIKEKCYDCHSDQTELKWFDKIVPAYWLVAKDVREGRQALNFSKWDSVKTPDQNAKMFEILNQMSKGAMPLEQYTALHPSARISASDIAVMRSYLTTLVSKKTNDTAKINAAEKQYDQWVKQSAVKTASKSAVENTLNGIEFMPEYKNWKVISTTDRFDNGTMRVIFGNETAIKAIQEGHINPWPDGSIFAKVAWDELKDPEGNISTGQFKQVEFMIKDAQKYKNTKGWGWARWKTPKYLPYGKTVAFTTECINCHRPMKDNDYVFTLPIKH